MKQKYSAAILLAMASASCALAYQLANAEAQTAQAWRPDQDSQLQSLDARLGERVGEFLELSKLLDRQLDSMNLKRALQQNTPLLTGTDYQPPEPRSAPAPTPSAAPAPESTLISEPPSDPVPTVITNPVSQPTHTPEAPAAAQTTRTVKQAPWWSRYRLSMVVHSTDVHSAVINGQYVRNGDTLANDIIVRHIAPGQVTLVRHGQTARLTIGTR